MDSVPFPRLDDGAPRLPVTLGSIADFCSDPQRCLGDLWRRHGEVAALQDDTQRLYAVFGPEYTRQVLSDPQRFHARFFAVRGPRHSAQRRVTCGLMSMNGEPHKQQRRIVMEPFQKRVLGGYHHAVLDVAGELLADWRPGDLRDMNTEMTRYMLRLTSRILFGLDQAALAYRVGELTEHWVALNHRLGAAALSPNPSATHDYEELLAAAEELEAAVREMIARRRGGRLGGDVLSLLIRAHEEGAQISEDELIGHIVLLFGAAHLTSAHQLTWTLLLLALHPEIMRELYDELTTELDRRAPTPEQLDALPMLDRVLKESLRILPASAYSQRITAEPVNLGPFRLPRGAVVIFSQLITHHMPQLYPRPQQFSPDRWRTLAPSPYAYFPFGAGPRMCIGAALGTMQLKLTLSTLLQRFGFAVPDGALLDTRVTSTMLYPAGEVPMRLEPPGGPFRGAVIRGNLHALVELPAADRSEAFQRRAA